MARPPKVLALVTLGAMTAALLAACVAAPASPVQLTQADNGSVQTLSAGQKLLISLDANPTTGYQWAVDGAVPPQLQQLGAPAYTASSSAIGSGGSDVWTFSAKASGQGTLKLKYWRSFESTVPPTETFQVTVNVK